MPVAVLVQIIAGDDSCSEVGLHELWTELKLLENFTYSIKAPYIWTSILPIYSYIIGTRQNKRTPKQKLCIFLPFQYLQSSASWS